MPKETNSKHYSIYLIKLQRSLYRLSSPKACGTITSKNIWNSLCWIFAIVIVYVEHLNFFGTSEELIRIVDYLKSKFEMKYLGKTKFWLGLQIEHFRNGVLVHQSTYIKKVLKRFHMDKSHPLNSLMIVHSLEVKNDLFYPKKDNEELLDLEIPYLSVIGALMYLVNYTRLDIVLHQLKDIGIKLNMYYDDMSVFYLKGL